MEDADIRRFIGSWIALGIVVLIYLLVALTAALDTKAIMDHKAKVLKEKLQGFDVVIEESVRK